VTISAHIVNVQYHVRQWLLMMISVPGFGTNLNFGYRR
jgi:hypothetical protein